MQTTAEKLNDQHRRDCQLNVAALCHAATCGVFLMLGGVNPFITGAATGVTFIVVKLLLSIRDRLPESN